MGSSIGAGHGVMWGAVRLDGETFTAKYLTSVRPDRELTAEQKQTFFNRLEHPKEIPSSFSAAEGWIHVAYDCAGVFREEEITGALTHRSTLDWLVRDPLAALRSLDPRPRKVLNAAYEVMGLAESFAGE